MTAEYKELLENVLYEAEGQYVEVTESMTTYLRIQKSNTSLLYQKSEMGRRYLSGQSQICVFIMRPMISSGKDHGG